MPEVASTRSPGPCESVPRRARSAKLPRTLHAIVIARCRFRRFSATSHFWVRTSFQAGGSRLRSRWLAPAHFRKSSWSGAHPFWPTRAGPNFAAKMPAPLWVTHFTYLDACSESSAPTGTAGDDRTGLEVLDNFMYFGVLALFINVPVVY